MALASGRELGQITDPLESLDSEFYVYPDDLTDLLSRYVSANPATFGPTPGGA